MVDSTVHYSLFSVCIVVSTVASALMFKLISIATAAAYHASVAGMNACRCVTSPAYIASLLQSSSLLTSESKVHVHAMRVTTQTGLHKFECYECINGIS